MIIKVSVFLYWELKLIYSSTSQLHVRLVQTATKIVQIKNNYIYKCNNGPNLYYSNNKLLLACCDIMIICYRHESFDNRITILAESRNKSKYNIIVMIKYDF